MNMIEIIKSKENDKIVLVIKGRLDTLSSNQLETEMKECFEDINDMTLDVKDLEYVSSSGLRLFLIGFKTMKSKGGNFALKNASGSVLEVLNMTGLSDLLSIN